MRVQEFKGGIRLTCTREEFIQLRLSLAERRSNLFAHLRSQEGKEDFEYERQACQHFKEVCDAAYKDMIQL